MEYAASPEGRRALALEAASKANERKELAEAARQLAVEEGLATPERTREWSDDEALEYAAIEPSPEQIARREEERLLSDPAAMAEAMADADRAAAKERLYGAAYFQLSPQVRQIDAAVAGVDLEEVAEYHRFDQERRFS